MHKLPNDSESAHLHEKQNSCLAAEPQSTTLSKKSSSRNHLSLISLAILALFIFLSLRRDACLTRLLQLPGLPQPPQTPQPSSSSQLELPHLNELPVLSHGHSLTHPTQLAHLPKHLHPTHSNSRRLILVGDVHGCLDSLQALLHAAHFDPRTDHLILTGDAINKGPDSHGVIAYARSVGASCVRGNHEDSILKELHGQNLGIDEEDVSEDEAVQGVWPALALSKADVAFIAECPLILDLGRLSAFPHAERAVVVHAGLVPGVSLERQDPWACMHMRALSKRKRGVYRPEDDRNVGRPWFEVWGKEMEKLSDLLGKREEAGDGLAYEETDNIETSRKKPDMGVVVIYGHDSKTSLNIRKWSKGLDSGCVNGERLSALVVDAKKAKVVSVSCQEQRQDLR